MRCEHPHPRRRRRRRMGRKSDGERERKSVGLKGRNGLLESDDAICFAL